MLGLVFNIKLHTDEIHNEFADILIAEWGEISTTVVHSNQSDLKNQQ